MEKWRERGKEAEGDGRRQHGVEGSVPSILGALKRERGNQDRIGHLTPAGL